MTGIVIKTTPGFVESKFYLSFFHSLIAQRGDA
jgi:hypothetical protein